MNEADLQQLIITHGQGIYIAVPEEDILAWHRQLLDVLRDEALPESLFETIDGLHTQLWLTSRHGRRVPGVSKNVEEDQ
jgi:hypothetical protein